MREEDEVCWKIGVIKRKHPELHSRRLNRNKITAEEEFEDI
jgi:hypothetical protein